MRAGGAVPAERRRDASSTTAAWPCGGRGTGTSSSRSRRRPRTWAQGSPATTSTSRATRSTRAATTSSGPGRRPRAPRRRRTPMWSTEHGRDDRLALQYWFFYPFNDYTNKHEGDWEMIQLVFAATDAAEALDQPPLEVGYSQHEGARGRRLGRPQARDRRRHPSGRATPPPARTPTSTTPRSTSARPAEQGFGCDDTRGPSDDVRPAVAVVPADPAAAARTSRGSPTRGGGASARSRSTTGRPARTPRTAGPTRSPTRSRRAATSATPCPPAGSSAPPPRTSSAPPSRAARRSSASSPTTPRACS